MNHNGFNALIQVWPPKLRVESMEQVGPFMNMLALLVAGFAVAIIWRAVFKNKERKPMDNLAITIALLAFVGLFSVMFIPVSPGIDPGLMALVFLMMIYGSYKHLKANKK